MSTTMRAERTLDLLRAIVTYYTGPQGRQVGHTGAVINGARNTPGAKVVVHDERMAAMIHRLTQGRTDCICLLDFEEKTKGLAGPILWDNAAILTLLLRCAHIIGDLLEERAEPATGPIHDAAHRKEGE